MLQYYSLLGGVRKREDEWSGGLRFISIKIYPEKRCQAPLRHADTLKGSSLNNLKELRAKTESHVFRVAFIFDVERKAILLTGGDKKGKNEKRFYRNLIKQAEIIYYQYLDDKGEE
jgi:hypothetical protein